MSTLHQSDIIPFKADSSLNSPLAHTVKEHSSLRGFINLKKIVIKVGTRVLTKDGCLEESQIKNISDQIKWLVKKGIKVILVSSGAIGAGMGILGFKKKRDLLPFQQGLAAVGQNELMNKYSRFLRPNLTAQILLTREDLNQRQRYLNVHSSISTLWQWNVVPIINENDSVSTEEIKFGDNDQLAALVANLISADLLLILSDVDGLYSFNGKVVPAVEKITPAIEKMAFKEKGSLTRGGMASKIQAAKIATESGIPTVIASGREKRIIEKIINGEEKGTLFLPCQKRLKARKRWIGFSSLPRGSVIIDEGAKEALIKKGKSLLSSGIIEVNGKFKIGDVVRILDEDKKELGRGLINYSSEEVRKIKGLKSNQIEEKLGYKDYEEVIHRDNLYCRAGEESE